MVMYGTSFPISELTMDLQEEVEASEEKEEADALEEEEEADVLEKEEEEESALKEDIVAGLGGSQNKTQQST